MTGKVLQGLFVGGRARMPVAQRRGTPRAFVPGTAAPALAAQRRGGYDSFQVDPGALGLVKDGGQPLPQAVLGRMEAALGADFSDVRVHVGPQAERIDAVAFTIGTDIYFAPGQFQPDTSRGQQMLGHELAHVVQQREGRVRNPTGAGIAVVQDIALEAEADRLGQHAAEYNGVAQRLSIVNWHSAAYQPNEVINNVYYSRRGSAGGNHFISDNWINTIIIDIVHTLTRTQTLPILQQLTAACAPPGLLAPNPPGSQRAFDDFLDDCIKKVSNADINRFPIDEESTGDAHGEAIDWPDDATQQGRAMTYAGTFRTAILAAYGAAGKQPTPGITRFLAKVKKYADGDYL